jgi:hypothetical protein
MASLGTANAAEKLQGLIDCTLAPGFPGWWGLAALPCSRSRRRFLKPLPKLP